MDCRRILSWRRAPRVRSALTVVLVLNVALGLSLSIIALRHQADGHADAERAHAWDTAVVLETSTALRMALTDGRVTDDLDEVSDTRLRAIDGVGADALADAVVDVRGRLRDGDAGGARRTVADTASVVERLIDDLRAQSVVDARSAARSRLVADVETVVLMLLAAVMALVMVRRTVAVRVHAEQQRARDRARSEARFSSLVRHSSDVISIVGDDGRIRFQTASAERVLGHEGADLVGTSLLDLVHPDDRSQLVAAHESLGEGVTSRTSTVRLRAADGTWRHVESVHTDLRRQEGVEGIVITSRDVTERVELERQVRHSALHDSLTGLANRALFLDRVDHVLTRQATDEAPATVLFLDLDDFKAVNDALGHAAGDTLLVEVARRLSTTVREGDTVARLGGDEFAVLLESCGTQERDLVLDRLQTALRRPVVVADRQLGVTASIGAAPAGASDAADAVLANADVAMYAAKMMGKGTLRHFDTRMAVDAARRLQVRSELDRALAEGHVRPWFQPTVSLATQRICGVEALARWEHPERGVIAPMDFIPIAEQTGQIVQIGETILREACRTLARWDAHPGVDTLTMAVNLSARELAEPDLVERVLGVLAETGTRPERLVLEVTESMLVHDGELAVDHLVRLRAAGMRVAIDDFGTGYSSLSYLERLPIDIVKIDKSFVDRVDGEHRSVLVGTIATLSKELGLSTVAEGIEHAVQASVLRDIGCDVGQGYLFSRPQRAEDLEPLLAEQLAAPAPDLNLTLVPAPAPVPARP